MAIRAFYYNELNIGILLPIVESFLYVYILITRFNLDEFEFH